MGYPPLSGGEAEAEEVRIEREQSRHDREKGERRIGCGSEFREPTELQRSRRTVRNRGFIGLQHQESVCRTRHRRVPAQEGPREASRRAEDHRGCGSTHPPDRLFLASGGTQSLDRSSDPGEGRGTGDPGQYQCRIRSKRFKKTRSNRI